MPRVITMHDVDDVEHWLASPKRDEVFKDIAFNMVTFVDPTEPNKLGLSANSPIGEAAMKHDGVHADTIVFMVEA